MSIVVAQQLIPGNFVRFDTFEGWSFTTPKTITKHPVIPSPEISDHVQVHNGQFSFRGFMGTPANPVPSMTADRARLFFDTIGGLLCVVTTPFGIFSNVVVQGTESATTGSYAFDLKGETVRIASITEVLIPPRVPVPAAAAQQSSSQTAGTAASGTSGASSLLASAADAAEALAGFLP